MPAVVYDPAPNIDADMLQRRQSFAASAECICAAKRQNWHLEFVCLEKDLVVEDILVDRPVVVDPRPKG